MIALLDWNFALFHVEILALSLKYKCWKTCLHYSCLITFQYKQNRIQVIALLFIHFSHHNFTRLCLGHNESLNQKRSFMYSLSLTNVYVFCSPNLACALVYLRTGSSWECQVVCFHKTLSEFRLSVIIYHLRVTKTHIFVSVKETSSITLYRYNKYLNREDLQKTQGSLKIIILLPIMKTLHLMAFKISRYCCFFKLLNR